MINSIPVIVPLPKAYLEPLSRALTPKIILTTEVKVNKLFIAFQALDSDPIVTSLPSSSFLMTNDSLAINVC